MLEQDQVSPGFDSFKEATDAAADFGVDFAQGLGRLRLGRTKAKPMVWLLECGGHGRG